MTTKRIYAQKLVDIRSEEVVVSGDITLEPRNPASPYPLVNGKPFVSGTEFGCINYVAPLLAPVSTFQLAQSVDIVGGGPSVSISGTDIEVKAGLYRFDLVCVMDSTVGQECTEQWTGFIFAPDGGDNPAASDPRNQSAESAALGVPNGDIRRHSFIMNFGEESTIVSLNLWGAGLGANVQYNLIQLDYQRF